MMMSQTQQVRERPVCGSESAKRCVLTPTHVEDDQSSTGDPYVDQHMLKKIQQVRGDPYWWIKKRGARN